MLAGFASQLAVKTDSAAEYTLVTKSASPFPQHKGHPLFFGMVKTGKAYVSLHLVPIYMCPVLDEKVSPELRKRMQGKACFNFKQVPGNDVLGELKELTQACLDNWTAKGWV